MARLLIGGCRRRWWYVSLRPFKRSADLVGTVPVGEQHLPLHQRLLDEPGSAQELGPAELPVRRWPERRVVVLVFATLLLTGAFAASMLSESALDELAVLYVVPVMLAGLELGVPGGAGGAAIAVILLFAASGRHSELAAVGLAASSASFLIAGVLAGRFSERMRAARNRQARLLNSGLRLARLDNLDALPTVLAEELEQTLDLASIEVQLRGAPRVEVGSSAGERLRVPISAHSIDFGSLTLGRPAVGPSPLRIVSSPRSWRCRRASRPTTSACSLQSSSERRSTPSSSTRAVASLPTCATSAKSSTAKKQSGAKSLATCTTRPRRRWPGFSWDCTCSSATSIRKSHASSSTK